MLSLVGIDSELVDSNSMNHMWNKVHIGNAWYNVDVTWDDPINDRPGHAQHTYFLLSDNAIQNLPSKHYDYTISNSANSTNTIITKSIISTQGFVRSTANFTALSTTILQLTRVHC